jgi:DNA-binding Lrp family transcriptional regulator
VHHENGNDSTRPTDARLLDLLQSEFPLVERPFAAIADRIAMSEEQVLSRVAALKGKSTGVIRQISAIFDSRALGYESSLVAAKIDPSKIDAAAAEISRHPGVSHNYARAHAYNLWYTVAVAPDSKLGLKRTVDILHARSGAQVTRLLPALRMFKIGVKFNLSGESDLAARDHDQEIHKAPPKANLTARNKAMIRVLQRIFRSSPVRSTIGRRKQIAAWRIFWPPRTLLSRVGAMRRFSAVLRHRDAGFGANAMGAWVVPPDAQEQFGALAAQFAAVSHCYLRPTYEDWPYSIFTMVHGKQASDCEAVLAEISRASGITEYKALYSTHEYKKIRVKYFTPEIERWELETT